MGQGKRGQLMLRAIINYFSFFVAGMLLLLMAVGINVWPASFWLEVRSIRVFDANVGDTPIMAVDRTIRRDFRGEWIASIRKLESGGWTSYCTAKGSTNYEANSVYPDPLTLKWWTHPDCHPLPPGKYAMRTSWAIKGVGPIPDKEVTADSNIFEIKS